MKKFITNGSRKFLILFLTTFLIFLFIFDTYSISFISKNEMVPMRDGIRLSTDIYLPSDKSRSKEKLPTILFRTPYGKRIGFALLSQCISKGYAIVTQDTRGRFESEGKSMSFLDDVNDGYDTVEWIASQQWSNGKVGTFGMSAMGIVQYLMHISKPPHLTCQYIMAASQDLINDTIYQGGGFARSLTLGWLKTNKFPFEIAELIISRENYKELQEKVSLRNHYSEINIPILHLAGWYDIFLQSTINAFEGIQKYGGQEAKEKQKLIIGPWTHSGIGSITGTMQGELRYPPNSQFNWFLKYVDWFDECLKGEDKGIEKSPKVNYYVMGDCNSPNSPGNEWRTSDVWPPVYVKERKFYFFPDGTISTERPTLKNGKGGTINFIADPANPVPTRGGANLFLKAGPMDQRSIESRDDVVTFSTPPLEKPLEVTGRIKVFLCASTDVVDTDFVAKLTDVYPDGRSMLLTDGIVRASYRNGLNKRELLVPGKVYQFEIDLWSTSIIFNKDHRIRVAIAGSNFPKFDVNQNNGEMFGFDKEKLKKILQNSELINLPDITPKTKIAHNTIYMTDECSSYILLPVAD